MWQRCWRIFSSELLSPFPCGQVYCYEICFVLTRLWNKPRSRPHFSFQSFYIIAQWWRITVPSTYLMSSKSKHMNNNNSNNNFHTFNKKIIHTVLRFKCVGIKCSLSIQLNRNTCSYQSWTKIKSDLTEWQLQSFPLWSERTEQNG